MHLGLVAIAVEEYDPAIAFFVDVLGFELAEDSPSLTNDGRPKRWVVVRPPGAATGLLLARAGGRGLTKARRQVTPLTAPYVRARRLPREGVRRAHPR